jgi:hypothetical protein
MGGRWERMIDKSNTISGDYGERAGDEDRVRGGDGDGDEKGSNSASKADGLVIETEEATPLMYAALEAIEAQGGPSVRDRISWERVGAGKWRAW